MKIETIDNIRNTFDKISQINSNDYLFKDIILLILNYQKNDGSFKLIDSPVPNDVYVYYNDETTYICTSLLIKAYVNNRIWFNENVGLNLLNKALKYCSKTYFWGHGYDGLSTQLNSIELLLNNNLKEFLFRYPNTNMQFSNMINTIIKGYKKRIKDNNYNYGFNNYEIQIKKVVDLYEN